MDKNQIIYLRHLVDLEKACYVQNETITQIEERIASLGHFRQFDEPNKPIPYASYDAAVFEVLIGAGAIVFGILGLLLFGKLLVSVVIGIFVGLIAAAILTEILNNSVNKEREVDYQQQMSRYDQMVSADKMRVESEMHERAGLVNLLAIMKDRYKKTKNTRDKFYSANIIYPKYRNLMAVCSFYEYFLSGRCDKYTGHEGAYNILETEIRFGAVLMKLDDILDKLDQIKINQTMLFNAISEGNQLTKELIDASNKQAKLAETTVQNTRIAAYNSEQTAIEASQIRWFLEWNNMDH